MKTFILILIFSLGLAQAQDLAKSFPVGKGSNFSLKMKEGGDPINLTITIASVSTNAVNIEYFMEANGLIPLQMWQQFEIAVPNSGPAQIRQGWVKTKELKAPEIMTEEYLKGFDGVQVSDFLFTDQATLDKNKIGIESVQIPAGKTTATHYRSSNNGQIVDYWISDVAKPIGLMRMISTHPDKPAQNYTLELKNLVNHVKPTIDPAKAVPLTAVGRSLLAKPEGLR